MQSSAQAVLVIQSQAHILRDLIRLPEADQKNILRQLIGVVFDDLLRLLLILVPDALRDLGADAQALQVDEHIPHHPILRPNLGKVLRQLLYFKEP